MNSQLPYPEERMVQCRECGVIKGHVFLPNAVEKMRNHYRRAHPEKAQEFNDWADRKLDEMPDS